MTFLRRHAGLILLLVTAALSSGCISQETLGRLEGSVQPEQVLTRPEVTGLIGRGVQVGEVLVGALTVILAFVCWYRAQNGVPFVGLAKEWILWVGVTVYLLATIRSGFLGPVMWLYEIGQYLGDLFAPSGGYFAATHDAAVGKMAAFLEMIHRGGAPGTAPPPGSTEAAAALDGLAFLVLDPVAVLGVLLNGIALHIFKLVLQVSYTILMVFYWTLTPIVAPTLVLPQSRHVFVGWAKSYLSVALWPFFFSIAEQLAVAIPWSGWMGIDNLLSGGDPISGVYAWSQGQVMLLVLNIAFLGVYASIPIISNRIVTGAAQPFRAGLL